MEAIILSIKPKYVNAIKEQTKNHEFRTRVPKKIPEYILVYETTPVAEIKYLLEVESPVEHPEKIQENGKGNKEFNEGEYGYRYAYPVKHMYKLDSVLTLATLKSEYDFSAPQSFAYIDRYPKLKEYVKESGLEKIF